jgi:hypothetical protein
MPTVTIRLDWGSVCKTFDEAARITQKPPSPLIAGCCRFFTFTSREAAREPWRAPSDLTMPERRENRSATSASVSAILAGGALRQIKSVS